MKVLFTLNNSFTFLGNFDEKLIEKFIPCSSVVLECEPHNENGYFLGKKAPFFETIQYPISISEKTLEVLPRIASIEADDGIIDSLYYISLDDGTNWGTTNHGCPKFVEIYPEWNIGDRVMISYTSLGWYNVINVDAPSRLKKKNFIIDARLCSFYKLDTIFWK